MNKLLLGVLLVVVHTGPAVPMPSPTEVPTTLPPTSDELTMAPTLIPSPSPTVTPTEMPTHEPTFSPTVEPTPSPTATRSPTELKCTDTPGWRNGHGFGNSCDLYAKTYCENGKAKSTTRWALGRNNNWPEHNCCVCGKGPDSPNVLIPGALQNSWGGACTCPNGEVYQVAETGCVGGAAGRINRRGGSWSHHKVNCAAEGDTTIRFPTTATPILKSASDLCRQAKMGRDRQSINYLKWGGVIDTNCRATQKTEEAIKATVRFIGTRKSPSWKVFTGCHDENGTLWNHRGRDGALAGPIKMCTDTRGIITCPCENADGSEVTPQVAWRTILGQLAVTVQDTSSNRWMEMIERMTSGLASIRMFSCWRSKCSSTEPGLEEELINEIAGSDSQGMPIGSIDQVQVSFGGGSYC